MRTFLEYHSLREEEDRADTHPSPDVMSDGEGAHLLNSAVEIAVKKGYKKQIIGFLKSLDDPEISEALEDIDKGLGDITKANNKLPGSPEDEVVPHATDQESPGLDHFN